MKPLLTCVALTCSIVVVFTNIACVIAQEPEAPRLDHVQLEASPLVQGVEGDLNIEAYLQVNGTC